MKNAAELLCGKLVRCGVGWDTARSDAHQDAHGPCGENTEEGREAVVKLYLFSLISSSSSSLACIWPGRSERPKRDCCFQVRMPSAQPLERSAGITWTRRLDSPLYLSRFRLSCFLITQRPWLWRRLWIYFRLTFFFLSFFFNRSQNQAGSAACSSRITSETPARLQLTERLFAAQRGSSQQLWYQRSVSSAPLRQFSAPLQKFWHQPLWI